MDLSRVKGLVAASVAVAPLIVLACGDHTTSPTPTPAPTPNGCVTFAPTDQTIGDLPTVGSITVTAPGSCAWTAVSTASFLTVTSGGAGVGSGTINYSVDRNSSGSDRVGTLLIGGRLFTLTQLYCKVVLSPDMPYGPNRSLDFGTNGGSTTVAVAAPSACEWTTSFAGNISWVSVTSGSSGRGNGSVTLVVAPNPGFSRIGSVFIGDPPGTGTATNLDISQLGAAGTNCLEGGNRVTPRTINVVASGASTTIDVRVGASYCPWTAISGATFINVTGGGSGPGNGTVSITIAPNTTGEARTGTLTIAWETVSVMQSAF